MPLPDLSRIRPSRPLSILSLIIFILFISSSLHTPDPASPHFQFPGLWPSKSRDLRLRPPGNGPGTPIFDHANLTRDQERRYAHLKKLRLPTGDPSSRFSRSGARAGAKAHRADSPMDGPGRKTGQGKYLFVTLTRNIQSHLPDMLNALAVLTTFLGPTNVRFSILEGPSSDSTPLILTDVLVPMLLHLGVPSSHIVLHTNEPEIDFSTVNRIEQLAEMRNKALSPLWKRGWDDTIAVVYFNDIYLRARDVLELLHQHVKAGEKEGRETGITTGMDWWKKSPEYYYDVWVARTMQGDLFYPMPNSWWSPSSDLFSTSPKAASAYAKLRPFQAFSSWAGMAVLAATPFLAPHHLRFRRSLGSSGQEEECAASECEIVNRDFWKEGWGRVQVVPSVQVAYEKDVALDIIRDVGKQMDDLGWYGDIPPSKDDVTVEFDSDPPSRVRCHAWPEKNGLDANVWEHTTWGPPYVGYE